MTRIDRVNKHMYACLERMRKMDLPMSLCPSSANSEEREDATTGYIRALIFEAACMRLMLLGCNVNEVVSIASVVAQKTAIALCDAATEADPTHGKTRHGPST